MNSSRLFCRAYFLGPDPNYRIYDRIVETHLRLKQSRKYKLLLLTFEGFPVAFYLQGKNLLVCDELLALGYWLPSSLPQPSRHFPLTQL
jgi:hypothetical protein